MQLGGREAARGSFKPIETCHLAAVRNCRFVIKLVQTPKPAKYVGHESHKLTTSNIFSNGHLLQPRRRLIFSCCAASADDRTSSSSSSSFPHQNLTAEEIDQRIKRAYNFITTSEKLIPFDPSSTNLGLVIWQALRDIPSQHRPELLNRLSSG